MEQTTIDWENLGESCQILSPEEISVMAAIRPGRDNAISMPDLADEAGMSTRELQDVVKHLIEDHNILIASATGRNHGYYIPSTEEEFTAAAAQIEHRIISLAKRLRAMNREKYEAIFGQSLLSFPGSTGESRKPLDARVKPDHDGERQ